MFCSDRGCCMNLYLGGFYVLSRLSSMQGLRNYLGYNEIELYDMVV